MGFLGDTWPFFRPNFINMETYRNQQQAQEVGQRRMGGCLAAAVRWQLLSISVFYIQVGELQAKSCTRSICCCPLVECNSCFETCSAGVVK